MVNLVEALNNFFENHARQMHTCLPGEFISYDHRQQRAKVQPLIKRKYADGTVQSLPMIVNVPVVWPRTSNCSLTFPINRGDRCLLLFAERSLDVWLVDGENREPNDTRKFDLSDGIAIPGLYSFNNESPSENNTDLLLKYGENRFRISPNGTITAQNESGATLNLLSNGSATLESSSGAVLSLLSNGSIALENSSGTSLSLSSDGKITLGASGVEVLSVLSQALGVLSQTTVTGTPIDQQGDFAALQATLETIRG